MLWFQYVGSLPISHRQTLLNLCVLNQFDTPRVLPFPRLRHRLRFCVGKICDISENRQALLRFLTRQLLVVDMHTRIRHLHSDLLPHQVLFRGVGEGRDGVACYGGLVVRIVLRLMVNYCSSAVIKTVSLLGTCRLLRFQGGPLLS